MPDRPVRLEMRQISSLIPYERNAKVHPAAQIKALRRSIREFGFIVPAGIDADGNLIYGHGRIEAARQEGITEVPCVLIDHLSETQRRAFVLADNRLSELASWDEELASSELLALRDAGFDILLTGFSPSDILITSTEDVFEDEPDLSLPQEPKMKPGQLYALGDHVLFCGDATSSADVQVCVGGGADRFAPHGSAVWRGLYGLRQRAAVWYSERQCRRTSAAA